jgi:hypothetical protein
MSKSKHSATALEVRKDTLPAVAAAVAIDHESFGEMSKADIAIPFLVVLQPLSPQCTPGHAKEVEGARPGMIYQTVTGELFTSVTVVPAEYKRTFIEWVPRDKGGGFRGERGLEFERVFESARNEKGRAILDNGNELADTRSWYVMVVREDGTRFPAIISMGSSQIVVSKKWNAMQITPPPSHSGPLGRSSYAWQLRTVLNKNEKGSWFGWAPARAARVEDEGLLADCAGFRGQVRGGTITVDHSQLDPSGTETSSLNDM